MLGLYLNLPINNGNPVKTEGRPIPTKKSFPPLWIRSCQVALFGDSNLRSQFRDLAVEVANHGCKEILLCLFLCLLVLLKCFWWGFCKSLCLRCCVLDVCYEYCFVLLVVSMLVRFAHRFAWNLCMVPPSVARWQIYEGNASEGIGAD